MVEENFQIYSIQNLSPVSYYQPAGRGKLLIAPRQHFFENFSPAERRKENVNPLLPRKSINIKFEASGSPK